MQYNKTKFIRIAIIRLYYSLNPETQSELKLTPQYFVIFNCMFGLQSCKICFHLLFNCYMNKLSQIRKFHVRVNLYLFEYTLPAEQDTHYFVSFHYYHES